MKLGFSATDVLVRISYNVNFCFYILSTIMSSSRDALLKLSKTTSPQKLFPSMYKKLQIPIKRAKTIDEKKITNSISSLRKVSKNEINQPD